MGKFIDLTGKRFGSLIVIKCVERGKNIKWLCKCDCGNECIVLSGNLRKGHTQSCGCLFKKMMFKRNKKYNKYNLTGDYGIGYTKKGEEFYFDLEDYNKIKNFYWRINDGYLQSSVNIDGEIKYFYLHCLIMGDKQGKLLDHKNNERNDCRKNNLRLVNDSQNQMNKCMQSNNTSGVIGVHWHKQTNKWQAEITVHKKKIYLGTFINIKDATKVRKEAEKKYFGEYRYKGEDNND